jgi:hypothetical protein
VSSQADCIRSRIVSDSNDRHGTLMIIAVAIVAILFVSLSQARPWQ